MKVLIESDRISVKAKGFAKIESGMNLIQIGSGAANFDENFQDGFTNFVKKKIKKGNIFVVEANSIHIKKLKKNWRKTKNVKIFNLAIIPDNVVKNKMVFFYSEDDKPDFQIFSNSNFFVKRHFPNSKIKKKVVRCISISNFFKKNFIKKIDFLSLDIEGMDFDKGGNMGRFNNLAVIQKILSNIGGKL